MSIYRDYSLYSNTLPQHFFDYKEWAVADCAVMLKSKTVVCPNRFCFKHDCTECEYYKLFEAGLADGEKKGGANDES